jgi:DNA polymerase I-like protein with 3'-5' exonuclease and polymerase domains
LRYAFGPAPGREWWALDYENIELRIPGYESGEEKMIELFEKPDEPPYFGSYHLLNASIVHPDQFWPIADKKGAFKEKYKATYYQWTKNGGFAKQYGAQRPKVDITFHREGAYDLLATSMPKMEALNRRMIEYANEYGYVETIPDKTINPNRGYPIMSTRSPYGSISPTIPLNHHVQSTAMWCTMKAMIRCQAYLKTMQGCRIVLQVHDELVFDLPKRGKKNLPIVNKLKSLMEQSGTDIGIPLRVAVSYHPNNWSHEEEPK